MPFITGRDIFSNLSTEDLLLDLFNTHFSPTGFFLKPYIRPLSKQLHFPGVQMFSNL